MQKLITLIYSIRQGIKGIKRNRMFSLASVGTITTCLFLFSIFFCILMNFQYLIKSAEQGISVTVFFDEGISQKEIDAIGQKIALHPEASKVEYISAEQAWENYKKEKLSQEQIESFGTDNPLANSGHYIVSLKDVAKQDELVAYLKEISGVRQVNNSTVVADVLSGVNKGVSIGSMLIIFILLGVSIFLISTTVTMGIAVRRQEISIMKIIGASDYFIRAPFIVEGVLIGTIGAVLPLALTYFVYSRVILYLSHSFSSPFGATKFLQVGEVFKTLTPVCLIIGIGIGFAGSFLTLGKQLRKIN